MQDLQYSLSTTSRMSYPAMSSSAVSPFPSYADPSSSYAAFPSKSSLLSLSRQASVDPSFLFSSSTFPPSRQASLSAFHDMVEVESFNFPSLVDGEAGEGELHSFKADADAFDLISRVSSFDSDVSSWASNASDDVDGYSAPRSPQSSVDSLSDSSQSDAELYSPYLSAASYPAQDQWAQPHFPKVERQAPSPPLKTEHPQVGLTAGAQHPNSPVPVLPLPFHQPVYAFNYHSVEDEPTPQSHSSRHERREGLRGGGDSRHGHSHDQQQRSSSHLHLRAESDLYAASAASTQPSTATSTAGSSSDAISPKSLLLSLSRTSAISPVQPSSHGVHHFSPSSSSSSASSTSVTSIHLTGPLDPNEVVIGIYTRAERAAKIARYREKRANRQWRKKILYGCRKSFADNRPRVGGRFIKMKTQDGEDAKAGGK